MLSSFSHANVRRDITGSATQTSRTSMPRENAQDLQIAKFCDSHSVSVRKIRQKMLRYIALIVQNNIRVKPLDYGCVRALPKEDVQPGD